MLTTYSSFKKFENKTHPKIELATNREFTTKYYFKKF
jgi:hypothetical protein